MIPQVYLDKGYFGVSEFMEYHNQDEFEKFVLFVGKLRERHFMEPISPYRRFARFRTKEYHNWIESSSKRISAT